MVLTRTVIDESGCMLNFHKELIDEGMKVEMEVKSFPCTS